MDYPKNDHAAFAGGMRGIQIVTNRQTLQTDRETDRHTVRETDRHTDRRD